MNPDKTLRDILTRHHWLNVLYGVVVSGGRTLWRRCPASRGRDEIQPPPFFVIGAARSGNTLLRALLVGHPALAIPPESYVLGGIARRWPRIHYLAWNRLVESVTGEFESHPEFPTWGLDLRPVRETLLDTAPGQRSLAVILDAIYRHYAATTYPDASIWGDKTPLNTERIFLIDRVFPGARYIHMLRDGRDAVSSAVEAGMFDSSVDAACRQWLLRVKNARILGSQVGEGRYLEVRYEDLVSGAEAVVKRVCAFLDIEFEEQMMEHGRAFDKMGDTAALDHHAKVGSPVTTGSIGKWKERLSAEQRQRMESLLRHELARTGYPV